MSLVRRLTMKISSLNANERAEKGRKEKTPCLTVLGVATRYKLDQTEMGEFIRFYGEFKSIDPVTGEENIAPQAIFPNVLQDILFAQLSGDVTSVEFAGVLGVMPDTGGTKPGVGYKYYFDPLIDISSSDRLSQLEAQIQKALPKPKE